ncbi:beta-galactosidase [Lentibacillus sediminis]|uniref:beta-galactosidase n=1 Tax=Lentibacillus sediminis TaxID=1940529 RepID=UPI000C1C6B05|nr:beta-galactosidase [Lentibacillus sediminis]
MIEVKNEAIRINGEETLLFGAELHYFRVPASEWKNRIHQVKEAGINMISTYVPWTYHEYQEGQIDLTGETRGERDLQTFLELVSEAGLYCLVRPGPYVMAEVIDHGVPPWFLENYPEAMARTKQGEAHPARVVSYLHPVFLEKAANWYHHVCKIIAPHQIQHGGPVILFQLDNEVGMFHWVTNQGDYNKVTMDLFEDYLDGRGEFAAGNGVTGSEAEQLLQAESAPNTVLQQSYRNFMRQHYRGYIEHLKSLALEEGIKVPFVVNIHGFHTVDLLKRGTMYPIGISQLAEAAKIDDVIMAGDYYIGNIEYDNFIDIVVANAFTKAIQWKEQPLFSAEFQGGTIPDKPRLQPTTFDLTTRLCLANGMNAANYYMFVGGENMENIGLLGRRHEWQAPLTAEGKKRPHFQVIQHLGRMLQVYQKPLLQTKQQTDTHLAFYPDYYRTEFKEKNDSGMIDELELERDRNLYNGFARGLRLNNIIFDGLNLMEDGGIDPAEVPTLWVFAAKWMDEPIQQKLADYLHAGGKLVLFPVIPTKNMNGDPCTILKDCIDVEIRETKRETGFVRVEDVDSVKVSGMEMYDTQEGAFGWPETAEEAVIGFEKQIGRGKLVMYGASMEDDYQYKRQIYRSLAERIGVKSRFALEDELDISMRSSTDGGEFIFLHNFDEYKKATTIHIDGNPLLDGRELTVSAKSGLMLPLEVNITDELTVQYGTGEIFQVEETDEELTLSVKMVQKEEVFVFRSSIWVPVDNTSVRVAKLPENGAFQVEIACADDVEMVNFKRK